MPFSEGSGFTALGPSGVNRLSIPSVREVEVGREYEGYTITRCVFNLNLQSATTTPLVVSCGLITIQEDVAVGTITPSGDPSADWFWFEEFLAPGSDEDPVTHHRDIRSQRKARGGDSDTYFYIVNRNAGSTVNVHRSGRMLVKRA